MYWFHLIRFLIHPMIQAASIKNRETMLDGYDIYGALSGAQTRSEAGETLAAAVSKYCKEWSMSGDNAPVELARALEEYDRS